MLLFLSALSHAATLVVDGTLQQTLDRAAGGDWIVIPPGEHDACLSITRDVRLIGTDAGKTVLTCAAPDTAILSVSDASLALVDVTLQGGTVGSAGISMDGGRLDAVGVHLTGFQHRVIEATDATLWLAEVSITDSLSTEEGVGLWLYNCDATLRGVTLSGLRGTVVGGAIDVEEGTLDAAGLSVTGCSTAGNGAAIAALNNTTVVRGGVLSGNSASSGGAIAIAGGQTELIGVEISGNVAAGFGGGLYGRGDLSTLGVLWEDNEAAAGGGLYLEAGTLRGGVLRGNVAGAGGGLRSEGAVAVRDGLLEGNTAERGGGIYTSGSLELFGVDVVGNEGGSGGGVYWYDGDLSTTQVSLRENTATVIGGGLFIKEGRSGALASLVVADNTAAARGGGIYQEGSQIDYRDLVVQGNEAADGGGGIYANGSLSLYLAQSHVTDNRSPKGSGGGIWVEDTGGQAAAVTLSGVHLAGNDADEGGGLWITEATLSGRASWLYDNTAAYRGGGVYAEDGGAQSWERVLWCGNTADGRGGGLYLNDVAGLSLSSSIWERNHAEESGGALYAFQSGDSDPAEIRDVTVYGNSATDTVHSGLVASNGAEQEIYDSVFVDNSGAAISSVTDGARQRYYGSWFSGHTDPIVNTVERIGEDGNQQGTITFSSTSKTCLESDLTASVSGAGASALFDDLDGDGQPTGQGDCDDEDASRTLGAAEVPGDGIDNDCLGGEDHDVDQDGALPESAGGADCDDLDATIHPGAEEIWYDGVDQDCDGRDDDQDADGYPLADDCDDTDATIHPGALERPHDGADQDCDGADLDDLDGDGHPLAEDCDDLDATIYPGAAEVWYDGVDQDCDGRDDDQDGDGYRRVEDCDDTDGSVHPGAEEVWYDGVDQDCDGADDDRDGDGLLAADDCDDQDPSVGVCPPAAEAEAEPGACGCAAAPAGWVWWAGLVVVWCRRARVRGRGGYPPEVNGRL